LDHQHTFKKNEGQEGKIGLCSGLVPEARVGIRKG
jgi:hypothetical protein